MTKVIASLIVSLLILGCQKAEDLQPLNKEPDRHPRTIDECRDICMGEIIYVPIYSSMYYLTGKRTLELTATLSVHNIDMERPIKLATVDYYSIKGKLIRKYLSNHIELQPLETVNFVVEQEDVSGGPGANFIVQWTSNVEVATPIVEAVMLGTSFSQGISFTTSGKVIKKLGSIKKNEPTLEPDASGKQ